MTVTTPALQGLLIAASLALSGNLPAAGFPVVTYELEEGSLIRDECLPCAGPINFVEEPLEGTFTLERLPVRILGELYDLQALSFHSRSPEPARQYAIQGSGQYHRVSPEYQKATLDLEVNGTAAISLSNPDDKAKAIWPAIDVEATEDGTRDPIHRYTIRIVARPKLAMVAYEVIPLSESEENGSYLIDDCWGCDARPPPPVPLEGTLLLGLMGDDPSVLAEVDYFIDALSLQNLEGFSAYRIEGRGMLRRWNYSGPPPQHDVTVQVGINADTGVLLASPQAQAPLEPLGFVIDFTLTRQKPEPDPQDRFYTLHILAKPVDQGEPRFRRGDANGDRSVDISDAVFNLLWQFSGGTEPGCLDAADTDDNGKLELTDAVFLLMYLFQGGEPLPDPGPVDCGPAPHPSLGCLSYPAC